MIVVTGATGQLGTAFRRLLGDDAHYLTRADLDLSDPSAIQPVLKRLRPTVLINCAAYTAVDRAESEPDVAEAINTTAVGVMAAVAADLGGRFVTFSTDYIFDGTSNRPYVESDAPKPINIYGRTKRQGEIAVRND
jgi:dTDP-4-dehydrorhamnose reductase